MLSSYLCSFYLKSDLLAWPWAMQAWVKEERVAKASYKYLWWLKHFCVSGNQNGWFTKIGLLCNGSVLFVVWNRLKTRCAHGGAGGGRRSQCHPLGVGDCERQTSSGGVWRHWKGCWPLGLHPQALSRWRVSCWLFIFKIMGTIYFSVLVLEALLLCAPDIFGGQR